MNYLADSLSERGLEVHVFSRKKAPEPAICRDIHFHESPWLSKAVLRPDGLTALSFARVVAVCLRNVGDLLNWGFDIVQSEEMRLAMPGMILSGLTGVPVVLDEPDLEFEKARQWSSRGNWRRIRFAEKLFCRSARQVLTSSKRERELMHHSFGLPHDRISLIPNGVDTKRFSQGREEGLRKRLGLAERPVVLFMGNFGALFNRDGLNFLLTELLPRVVERVPDVAFLVIGKGLDSKFGGHTYNFKPMGFVADPREYLDVADVCIAPLRYGGGTRIKILEYMSMAKPVVATSKGCEGLHVTHESDILVEDTVDGFAGAVATLLRDVELASRIGRRARETAAKRYDWSEIAARLESVYVEVVEKSSSDSARHV